MTCLMFQNVSGSTQIHFYPDTFLPTGKNHIDQVEEGGGGSKGGDGERKAESQIKIQEEARFVGSSFYWKSSSQLKAI